MSAGLRVYLPLRPDQVRELADTGRLAGPVAAVAVSDTGPIDVEEREHAALQQAARVALQAGHPVLVAALDVAAVDVAAVDVAAAQVARADPSTDGAATPAEADARGGAVTVTGGVVLSRVAALLVGDDVLGIGSVLDDRGPVELSWFDTTELTHLVSLLEP